MKWISIKDRLPRDEFPRHDPCPDVLVYCFGDIKIAKQWQCGAWTSNLYPVRGITHWMPLPKPPNGA
jgi:hypothetical protein